MLRGLVSDPDDFKEVGNWINACEGFEVLSLALGSDLPGTYQIHMYFVEW